MAGLEARASSSPNGRHMSTARRPHPGRSAPLGMTPTTVQGSPFEVFGRLGEVLAEIIAVEQQGLGLLRD